MTLAGLGLAGLDSDTSFHLDSVALFIAIWLPAGAPGGRTTLRGVIVRYNPVFGLPSGHRPKVTSFRFAYEGKV